MRADKREARLSVIEPDILFPRRITVAPLALIALLASMCVIVPMADHAGHIEPHFARRLYVACSASLSCMRTTQREVRLACVIETSLPPVPFVMAILASHTIASLVRTGVLITVAGHAIGRQSHLARRLHMAATALDGRVPPAKWKAGTRVIKPG